MGIISSLRKQVIQGYVAITTVDCLNVYMSILFHSGRCAGRWIGSININIVIPITASVYSILLQRDLSLT